MSETIEPIAEDDFEWAIVEIFGHRRHAGRIREEEKFGAKMLRIDVPTLVAPEAAEAGKPIEFAVERWTSHWYGGSSIFSLTLTDEGSVMRVNRPYASASRYLAPPDRYDGDASEDVSALDDIERPW
ncbi:hypothetical protein [Aminobacter aminovorans]|uniref:Uncharacterized protein n=1 Tax=Aminobacter aminovorans TaxID=83263 RepID=A0AAC8YMR2_AMIAI|nr:hypothetical protein [Aminobacter aminovorans]AMS41225.1 hypothetical protein AA2016_2297 [Aminobacter aminovorans]MBB3705792.1 hypothetical protein [Aminobacter aminovorans]